VAHHVAELEVLDEGLLVAIETPGEHQLDSGGELRLALWRTSTTTANLERDGRATLTVFLPPAAYYVELDATRDADIRVGETTFARFTARPRAVREDVVGYATLDSGIRFRLPSRDKVLARWRAQIAALRA
jgi:hypothetical protein